MLASRALAEIFAVGTSAGGARAKAVLAINDETHEVRAGNIPVPDGFGQYLLKFDGVSSTDKGLAGTQPYCRREYAYFLMAQAAGVDMSPCRLLEENGRAHFLTRRFDRVGNEPLHMQTLCALQALDYNLVGTHDYAQYFATINALDLGEAALVQGFRRMAFNVLAANHDDHTKNLAFVISSTGTWSLSPAYDLTFAYDPDNHWLRAHLMGVLGKFTDITAADLLAIADQFAIPYARSALAEVRDAIGSWGEFASAAGLAQADTDMIGAHLSAAAV
ncbi:type II toxin-antitoxin system HipA family toxin [Aeromicrobium sp. UC242_57]|uniref:type II toxin-antitoxin system HipA family toxin n=1 Tax=Aeromicrobium sp. UC242_57 TaxID=3374624 RepID=UPI003799DCAB